MTIDSLYIYPIKSFAGIKIQEAEITPRGFRHDRAWMLIDAHGRFVSQREIAELALMKVSIFDDALTIVYNDQKIHFHPSQKSDQYIETKLWNDVFKSCLVANNVSEWFSDVLGKSLRLVTYSSKDYRVRNPSSLSSSIEVSYADGYPYLIIGTASLDDLNGRLDKKVKMNRFRPNVVVKTSVSFEEDEWKNIEIGHNSYEIVKPCARCIITTIDQDTLKRSKEPLYTLAKYRQRGKDILFGVNAIASGNQGIVKVGDTVRVNE